ALWGNPNQVNFPGYNDVWDAGHLGVWHLNHEHPSGNQFDATANNTIMTRGGEVSNITAVVGSGQAFDGAGDYLLGNMPGGVPQSVTLEAWIFPTAGGVIFSELGQGTINSGWHDSHIEVLGSGEIRIRVWNGPQVSLGTFPLNEWRHVALTFDDGADALRGFVDGVERNMINYNKLYPGNLWYALGANDSTHLGDGTFFDGWMDEARISRVARAPDWIWATWQMTASNHAFNAYGSVALGLNARTQPPTGVTPTGATLNGQLISAGGAENPNVFICWGATDGGVISTSNWDNVVALGNGWTTGQTFSTTATLLPGADVYYRTYVTNSTGFQWSKSVQYFITGDVEVNVSGSPILEN
ncbi:MAG: LamG domain-containing protein, partial [Verrucomicrobiota bacterium]